MNSSPHPSSIIINRNLYQMIKKWHDHGCRSRPGILDRSGVFIIKCSNNFYFYWWSEMPQKNSISLQPKKSHHHHYYRWILTRWIEYHNRYWLRWFLANLFVSILNTLTFFFSSSRKSKIMISFYFFLSHLPLIIIIIINTIMMMPDVISSTCFFSGNHILCRWWWTGWWLLPISWLIRWFIDWRNLRWSILMYLCICVHNIKKRTRKMERVIHCHFDYYYFYY